VSRENYRASDVALANQAVLDLGELGYGGLNDSAYKAVLLVEGVSEVKLFQELHNKFGARNEVVIVPLGGDSLASGKSDCELAELRRLSDTTFAVVDSERQGKGAPAAKRRRDFRANCEALGRRAIENYLDQDVARRVLRKPEAKPFGEFDRPGHDWQRSKEKNWRVMQQLTKESLEQTDLGKFAASVATRVRSS